MRETFGIIVAASLAFAGFILWSPVINDWWVAWPLLTTAVSIWKVR